MSGTLYVIEPRVRIVVIHRDSVIAAGWGDDIEVEVIRDGVMHKYGFSPSLFLDDEGWQFICDVTFNETDHDITWQLYPYEMRRGHLPRSERNCPQWMRTLGRPTLRAAFGGAL